MSENIMAGARLAAWCEDAWRNGMRSWHEISEYIQGQIALLPEQERQFLKGELELGSNGLEALTYQDLKH